MTSNPADPAERAAIERVARDYFDSWFEGDPERMRRVLHPNLAKRRIADGTVTDELWETTASEMVDDTSGGPKDGYDRSLEVEVMDVSENIATVRVRSDPFIEYLHLGRFGDRWLIVNAFYRRNRRVGGTP